jgi:hypothetical protein
MKKIIIGLLLISLAFTINAQSFKGFFKPVATNQVYQKAIFGEATASSSQWLFRPAVFITADAIKLSGGVAITQPLSSLGTGISFSNYIDNNGTPYAQFNVSALLMTNINLNGTSLTSLGGGLIVGAFNGIVNVGAAVIGGKVYGLLGTSLKL